MGLMAPQLVRLSGAQEREAVVLLAQVLLDVARKGRGSVCGGGFAGGSGGAISGGDSLRAGSGKARKAA